MLRRRRERDGRVSGAHGFDGSAYLHALPFLVLAVVAVLAATFAVALAQHRHSVIDTAWGLAFGAVALVGYAASAGHGDDGRRLLVTALTCVWGLRLAAHIGWRARGAGEDPRYVDLLAKAPGNRNVYALRSVYLVQGVALLFVSIPVQVTLFSGGPLHWLAWVGVAVWAVGLFFESVGDFQLSAFKADPAHKGVVMDRGLWRYTRHPNYFGDACVWWGLYLVAASAWPGALTVLSPLVMTYVLARGTGKKLLEGRMGDRPGFAEYVRRTSGFVPLPPRQAKQSRPS
jgi:steroid 5-alpha reductase family enzyme